VLEHGHVRGVDLWHLACALFLADDPAWIHFATFDQEEAQLATALGFQVLASIHHVGSS